MEALVLRAVLRRRRLGFSSSVAAGVAVAAVFLLVAVVLRLVPVRLVLLRFALGFSSAASVFAPTTVSFGASCLFAAVVFLLLVDEVLRL